MFGESATAAKTGPAFSEPERSAVQRAAAAAGFDAAQFRAELRAFCRDEVPADIRARMRLHQYFTREQRIRWQQLLQTRGWFIGHWPKAHGGAGWGPLQRFIFIEELERAGTPWLTHFGTSFLGPVLCAFGMLMGELKHDFVRTFVARLEGIDWPRLAALTQALVCAVAASAAAGCAQLPFTFEY